MATKKNTKVTEADETVEGTDVKAVRPSAIVGDINFDGIDAADLDAVPARRSPWDDVLDKVYAATEAGDVPRDGDGALKFVKIGSYAQGQSAKAQVKAFASRKLDATYEFKVHGKDLLVRVRETEEG